MESPSAPNDNVKLFCRKVGNVTKNWKPTAERLKKKQPSTPTRSAASEVVNATTRSKQKAVLDGICKSSSPPIRIAKIVGIGDKISDSIAYQPPHQ